MKIKLTENIRGILDRWREHDSPHIRNRADIILLTAEGKTPEEISAELRVGLRTVNKWLNAWEKQGLNIFQENSGSMHVAVVDGVVVKVPAMETYDEERIPIAPDDTMAEAGRKVLLHDLTAMIFYEKSALTGEHSEGVHKMRVATRRLRSAHKAFRPYLDETFYEGFTKPLRHTARTLGAVRDLDVFLIKTQQYVDEKLEGNEAPLLPFLEITRHEYTAARAALTKWLNSKTYQRFVENFHETLAHPFTEERLLLTPEMGLPVRYVLPEIIFARVGAVRRFETHIADADLPMMHQLRIELKRLRYTLEFFESVLGVGSVIKKVKDLQEILGDLNDTVVAVNHINRIYKHIPKKERDGMKAYRDFRHDEMTELVEKFPEVWGQFNRVELRQALAEAVAVL